MRLAQTVSPEAVIHCQALSDVDKCELDPKEAKQQNCDTAANLMDALKGSGALFVYVSTDYVFDGKTQAPYDEEAQPNPVSVYGKAKLAGEQAVLRYTGGIVVRPSTLFGRDRMNFCDAVVSAAREGRAIEAFSDQTTSPTYTEDMAEALSALIKHPAASPVWQKSRIVHVTNSGFCTRLQFATRTVDLLGLSRDCLKPILMEQQHRPAPRPAFSALTSKVLPRLIGRSLRSWDQALHAYLTQRHWLS